MGRYRRLSCVTSATLGTALILAGVACSPGLAKVTEATAVQTAPTSPPPAATEKDAAPPFASNSALTEISDPEALFQLILAEQEKSQQKLCKLQFTSRWEVNWVLPGYEKKLVHERKVIRDGKNVWCELHLYPAAQNGVQPPDGLSYSSWNDHYFATWAKGTVLAHILEYNDIDSVSKDVRIEMGVVGAFPERRYAYGNGKDPLSKVASLDPKSYPSKFEAEQCTDPEGHTFYTLKAWMSDRVVYPRPTWILTVNPAIGYQVTGGVYQFADLEFGKLREFSVSARELSPGIWFPVEWIVTDYGNVDMSTGDQPVVKLSKYSVIDIEMDPTIDAQQFTWKSLNIPPETKFLRCDSSGEFQPMKQENGELIPNEFG